VIDFLRVILGAIVMVLIGVIALYAVAQVLLVLAIAYPMVSFGVYLDDKGTNKYDTWDI
jgi:hypothetical protein